MVWIFFVIYTILAFIIVDKVHIKLDLIPIIAFFFPGFLAGITAGVLKYKFTNDKKQLKREILNGIGIGIGTLLVAIGLFLIFVGHLQGKDIIH